MRARIYKPDKNAMQSGTASTKIWLLEYLPQSKKEVEPLMGWVSSGDTQQQVRLRFENREQAENFASRKGLKYTVIEPKERKVVIKSYADNFAYKTEE